MSEPRTRWRSSRLSRHVQILGGRDYSHFADDTGTIPVYGSGGIFASASEPLYSGSGVLFGRKGTIDKPLFLNGDFWITDTAYFVKPLQSDLAPRFLYYWALNFPFRLHSTDTALPSMTSSAIGGEYILLPDRHSQLLIIDFLDRETAEIDELIADLEIASRLAIEKSQSRWDDDLDWIGLNAESRQLKFCLSAPLSYGANLPADQVIEGDVRYLRITDFAMDGTIRESTRRTLPINLAIDYIVGRYIDRPQRRHSWQDLLGPKRLRTSMLCGVLNSRTPQQGSQPELLVCNPQFVALLALG